MLKLEVQQALHEIEAVFPGCVQTREDGQGGVFVLVDPAELGAVHTTAASWIGFHIPFQYPFADVYPHYAPGDLARADGAQLGAGMSGGHNFEGRAAVQLSRRSNRHNPAVDTAVVKLLKVLEWVRTQS